MSTPAEESIVWAAIVRDETLLLQARSREDLGEEIVETARGLLNRPPGVGWEAYSHKPWPRAYKGIRFHVYQKNEMTTTPRLWIFGCVYNPAGMSKRQAQVFLEKIVMITEIFRETDEQWQKGEHNECQEIFGPILEGKIITANEQVHAGEETLEYSMQIMNKNRDILDREKNKREREIAEKKAVEEAMLKQMEEMNRSLLEKQSPRSAKKKLDSSSPDVPKLAPSPTNLFGFRKRVLDDSQQSAATVSTEDTPQASVVGGDKVVNKTSPIDSMRRRLNWVLGNKTPQDGSSDTVEDFLQRLERDAICPSDRDAHEPSVRVDAGTIAAVVVLALAILLSFVPHRHFTTIYTHVQGHLSSILW